MKGRLVGFWGKLNRDEDGSVQWHPLADHCADVAAVCEALLRRTLIRRRLAALGEAEDLAESAIQRLAALAAFHDVGKFNHGFQRKANPEPVKPAGHVIEVLDLFGANGGGEQRRLRASMPLDEIASWTLEQNGLELLFAAVAHHGRPQPVGTHNHRRDIWQPEDGLDPFAGISALTAKVRTWYPKSFGRDAQPLPSSALFQHAFSGLVTLADWIASNREVFTYSDDEQSDRMPFARATADKFLREIWVDSQAARELLGHATPEFSAIAAFAPNPAQQRLLDLDVSPAGSLTLLESETGSGKTEAALARFIKLFHAGVVDGLYFALPTRTAATQMHKRVSEAIGRAFGNTRDAPPVILAVPGYLDHRNNRRLLASFPALWNDDEFERLRFRHWASELPKRYLASTIAVGTVDQALLSALAVSHSHLRATALLRHLLVVDEVHASDAYMNTVLHEVLRFHLKAGGHALLLSATLGSSACARLLDSVPTRHVRSRRSAAFVQPLAEACTTAYPLLTTVDACSDYVVRAPLPLEARTKRVRVKQMPYADKFETVAGIALEAVQHGARVLIVRNTVRDCIRTQAALEGAAPNHGTHLFNIHDVIAPHHARFAREDRELLDRELEHRFGRNSAGPCVVSATQTVQQSLDIDADLMLTDLCPIDVMLQRIGRLHRHQRIRPPEFGLPQVVVLVPEKRDLSDLIRPDGNAIGDHGFGTVYEDLRLLEATWRLFQQHPELEIPAMNRCLVEAGTHPEALRAIVHELGGAWKKHEQTCQGRVLAERDLARLGLVDREKHFGECQFPSLDRRIRTRLGQDDRIIRFPASMISPFGANLHDLSAPAWLMGAAPDDAEPQYILNDHGTTRFKFGALEFIYDRLGLRPVAELPPGRDETDG